MGASTFTHLHTHTEYSLLDGLSRVEPLVERAKDLGMDSLGITDHGALHAAVEFYTAATKAGIKPIIGIEGYLARGSRLDKASGDKQPYHITLLAKDDTGYRNLLKLGTLANLEGYYYKPRIDHELLQRHSQGVVAFSGCLNGEVPKLIQAGRMEDARKAAGWFQDVLGEDFYLELQWHDNIPELVDVNKRLVEMSRELHIPLVATNDVHYIRQEDHAVQDTLLCIQTNSMIDQQNRMRMSDASYYLRSAQEMEQIFSNQPDAILNTRRIADKCNVKIDFSRAHLPRFPVPNGKSADEYLGELCQEGLRRRYPVVTESLQRRLDYEMDVIRKTHFSDYFLVVWHITSFVRQQGILMGVRGSAAASLVLYCLFITNVDPLKYRLVFERFLNIERKEMPDIDMDFQDDRRDEVMRWVVQQYGEDKVAQIITFGTMGAKAVLRDVGRVKGMAYGDVDAVARMIPTGYRKADKGQIKAWTIDDALELIPEFRQKYDEDYAVKGLIDAAKNLEGSVRNAGTHAAGVVISDEPLVNYVPLQRPMKGNGEGIAVTQYPMEAIAKLGLLKMDFLGLVNLTILQKTRQYIADSAGGEVDLLKVPLDDKKTFGLLGSGDTSGVFQLESTGMRRYIKELKPSSLADLSAMIALYRPGPLEQIPNFIESKHGKREVSYPHPILKDILEETYGIIVYQDQVLLILREFAGYSLGQADIVRKAMGKKIAALMQQEHGRFIEGAQQRGFSADLAQKVWDLIEPFAGYAFNKAHSVSYGLIAYWTAYFKANHQEAYMAALLTCFAGTMEKVVTTVVECRRLGIPVLQPDINHSDTGFVVERPQGGPASIRFGLAAIKNVGEAAVRPLIEERRKNGPFKSIQDLCGRASGAGLNRKSLECLIKVGALDSLGPREALLNSVERIIGVWSQQARRQNSGQASMFDMLGDSGSAPMPEVELNLGAGGAVSTAERSLWEKELLGVSLSADNSLMKLFQVLGREVTLSGQVDAELEGQKVTVAGRVASLRVLQTKKDQRSFAIVGIEDLQGKVEVTVWPNTYESTTEMWKQDALVIVKGKVRMRNDQASIACDEVQPFAAPAGGEALDAASHPDDSAAMDALMAEPAGPAPASSPMKNANGKSGHTGKAVPEAVRAASPPLSNDRGGSTEVSGPGIEPGQGAATDISAPAGHGASPGASGLADRQATGAPIAETDTGASAAPSRTLWITLPVAGDEGEDIVRFRRIVDMINGAPGNDLVRMILKGTDEPTVLDWPNRCNASGVLTRDLMAILGPNGVRVQE